MSSADKSIKKAKLAVSKAQQAVGQVPPDLANRITALESLIASGYSGSISIVTSVNFTAQTVTTQTITMADGIITGVV